jgi:hypothetical protein
MKRTVLILSVAFCLIFMVSAICAAQGGIKKCREQTVIVGAAYNFLNTLTGPIQNVYSSFTVRNVDPQLEITVVRVDFHDPEGSLVIGFVPQDDGVVIDSYESKTWRASPATLYPIGEFEYDSAMGRPFFKVEWVASKKVIEPMISGTSIIAEGDVFSPTPSLDFKALSNLGVKIIDQKCNKK